MGAFRPGYARGVVSAVVFLAAMAVLEWWSTRSQGLGIGSPGVFSGIAGLALMFLVALALERGQGKWAPYLTSTLLAVTELIVGMGILGALVSLAMWLLPFSVAQRLFASELVNGLIVLSLSAVGVLVSARSVRRYTRQKARALEAQIEAAESRAAFEAQKSRALQAQIAEAGTRAKFEEERLQRQVEGARNQAALMEKEKLLAHAELALLRKQIEPHYIFNTLGNIQHLVEKDPQAAARMVSDLAKYIRGALYETKGESTSLGSEFESASAYLEIMKARFGARLSVSVDLPALLSKLSFEPMLVLTLVENAVKHGVEPKVGPVAVSLSARMDEGEARSLIVEVRDDGVGLQSNAPTSGTGLGLDNVRRRIKARYGDDARLSIGPAPDGGVVSRIILPLASMGVQ